jgi:hypothetical protein
MPILITTANPTAVEKALINNLRADSEVKFVAIIPEPTMADAKIAVPKNSIAIARFGFIFLLILNSSCQNSKGCDSK